MKDKEKQIEEKIMEIAECNKESCQDCKITCTYYYAIKRFCELYLPEDSVVLSREEYEKLLARLLETMGDLVISKIKEEKCKCFKEIDYGYRQSKQCYAQKYAAEFNCNGCKRNCEKYPKIGEEK